MPALTVEYSDINGRRRVRYEPDGMGGYRRITEVHTGTGWRQTGWEPVEDLVCETHDETVIG